MTTKTTVTAYLETLLWSETYSAADDDSEPRTVNDDRFVCDGDTLDDGTPLDQIIDVSDLDDLNPKISAEAAEDLDGFAAYCEEVLGFDPFLEFDSSQVAHDFALSRNGHGAGFFDREGYTLNPSELASDVDFSTVRALKRNDDGTFEANDALQEAAKTFGTIGLSLWLSEDGKVCIESHG